MAISIGRSRSSLLESGERIEDPVWPVVLCVLSHVQTQLVDRVACCRGRARSGEEGAVPGDLRSGGQDRRRG